jgi:hypothetical protein
MSTHSISSKASMSTNVFFQAQVTTANELNEAHTCLVAAVKKTDLKKQVDQATKAAVAAKKDVDKNLQQPLRHPIPSRRASLTVATSATPKGISLTPLNTMFRQKMQEKQLLRALRRMVHL